MKKRDKKGMKVVILTKSGKFVSAFNNPQMNSKLFNAVMANPVVQERMFKINDAKKEISKRTMMLVQKLQEKDLPEEQKEVYQEEFNKLKVEFNELNNVHILNKDVKHIKARIMERCDDLEINAEYPGKHILYYVQIESIPKTWKQNLTITPNTQNA